MWNEYLRRIDECEWSEPVPAAHDYLVEVFKTAQLSRSMSNNAERCATATFFKAFKTGRDFRPYLLNASGHGRLSWHRLEKCR
jgi:hypothetical protein